MHRKLPCHKISERLVTVPFFYSKINMGQGMDSKFSVIEQIDSDNDFAAGPKMKEWPSNSTCYNN